MRISVPALVCVGCAWLAAGCARPTTVSVAPHPEELPKFERTERVIPARIGVEGRDEQLSVLLVPKFTEPELTPQEKRALGQEEPAINWLEFYVPPREGYVGPGTGGVSAAIGGRTGVALADRHERARTASMWSGLGGASVSAMLWREISFAQGLPRPPTAEAGPPEAVQIGVNPRRGVAAHERRSEK